MSDNSPIILAYSGGLDTSFCVPWLKETYNRPVVTMGIIQSARVDAHRHNWPVIGFFQPRHAKGRIESA